MKRIEFLNWLIIELEKLQSGTNELRKKIGEKT